MDLSGKEVFFSIRDLLHNIAVKADNKIAKFIGSFPGVVSKITRHNAVDQY